MLLLMYSSASSLVMAVGALPLLSLPALHAPPPAAPIFSFLCPCSPPAQSQQATGRNCHQIARDDTRRLSRRAARPCAARGLQQRRGCGLATDMDHSRQTVYLNSKFRNQNIKEVLPSDRELWALGGSTQSSPRGHHHRHGWPSGRAPSTARAFRCQKRSAVEGGVQHDGEASEARPARVMISVFRSPLDWIFSVQLHGQRLLDRPAPSKRTLLTYGYSDSGGFIVLRLNMLSSFSSSFFAGVPLRGYDRGQVPSPHTSTGGESYIKRTTPWQRLVARLRPPRTHP
jgi:hypothetical protein